MKQTLAYTSSIFATTALLGPVMVFMVLATINPLMYNATDALYLFMAIPASFLFLLPSWLVLWWLTTYLIKSFNNIIKLKAWLSLACLPLSILPFIIIDYRNIVNSNYWPSLAPWLCVYAGLNISGIWLYKLKLMADRNLINPA